MEIHPLTIAADLAKGIAIDLNDLRTFSNCLGEHPNLHHILTQKSEGLQDLYNMLDNVEKAEDYAYCNSLDKIFCRTIQILSTKGFHSAEYQNLISNPVVARAAKYTIRRTIPSFGEYLPPSTIISLFDYQIFAEESKWEKTINNPSLASDCQELIRVYLNLLSNESMTRESHYEMREAYFPLVFFASIVLALQSPTNDALRALITSEYMGVSLSGLWLQRQVFLMMYDALGLAPFLPYRDVVRSGLMYYLVISGKLTNSEKEILKREILESKFYARYLEMLETDKHKADGYKKPTPFHLFLEPYLLEFL